MFLSFKIHKLSRGEFVGLQKLKSYQNGRINLACNKWIAVVTHCLCFVRTGGAAPIQ